MLKFPVRFFPVHIFCTGKKRTGKFPGKFGVFAKIDFKVF